MVDLHVQREAPALEPLDDMDLPRRPGQVEVDRVQPGDQDAKLPLVTWTGQGRPPDIVIEVESSSVTQSCTGLNCNRGWASLRFHGASHFLAPRLVDHGSRR